MTTDVDWDDDIDTELCHDDGGFVYRRKRRRRSDDEPSASASTQTDLEQERRLWRRNTLVKLKNEYRKEIQDWEFLSESMEDRPAPVREGRVEASDAVLVEPEGSGSDAARIVDQLLIKAEAQGASISHISNLCDVAESVCSELEEQWNKFFIDLSVWPSSWSSPRKLMSFLCN